MQSLKCASTTLTTTRIGAALRVSLVAAVRTGCDCSMAGQALLPNEVGKLTEAKEKYDHAGDHAKAVIDGSETFICCCP